MENPIVRTIIKERDDYKFIKCFDKVGDEVNALITDVDDIRQTVSALIDDLQTIGLVG